jgi:DNA-binding NarL/FixJ family response regulator
VALAIKVALRRDGRFAVTGDARTAAEGLVLLDEHDVVVLDLHLPDLSGADLVRAFRERAPHVPLILHTGADETPEVQAVRPLVDAVAPKGSFADLLPILERLT